jgi:hypothetical protein
MSKWRSVLKSVVVLPFLSTLFTQSNYASERFDYQRVQLTQAGVDADITKSKLSDLQLFLNDPSQQPLLNLKILKTASFLSALRICDECRHVSSRLCAVGCILKIGNNLQD